MTKSDGINLERKKLLLRHLCSVLDRDEGHQSFLNVYVSFQAPLFKTGAYNQLTRVRNEAESVNPFFSHSLLS